MRSSTERSTLALKRGGMAEPRGSRDEGAIIDAGEMTRWGDAAARARAAGEGPPPAPAPAGAEPSKFPVDPAINGKIVLW